MPPPGCHAWVGSEEEKGDGAGMLRAATGRGSQGLLQTQGIWWQISPTSPHAHSDNPEWDPAVGDSTQSPTD